MPVDSTTNRRCKIAGSTSIGNPPKDLFFIERMYFYVHNFASREERRGQDFSTGVIVAHGHPWKLSIYPRGHDVSNADAEYVSIFLDYAGNNFEHNPVVGKGVIRSKKIEGKFNKNYFSREAYNCGYGCYDFATRDVIINKHCDQVGTLTIEVDLEIVATETKRVWYPQLPRSEEIVSEFYSHIQSPVDVTLIVGRTGKEVKAHKRVLALRAKELYELVLIAEDAADTSTTNIVLSDVDETVFEAMMEFIYTGKEPKLNDEDTAKSIIFQADRFGCTELKLFAESILVGHFLVPSTAAGLLLFADSHSCALLKEASMDLYALNPTGVMKAKGNDEKKKENENDDDNWANLEESPKLLSELLRYTNIDRKQYLSVVDEGYCNNSTPEDADNLGVTSLRERLQNASLDVDGSREMLVKRWKEHLRLPTASS